MRLIMNNPFEYVPNVACEEAFRKLTERIEVLKGSDVAADADLCRELAAGKMLGVLIAEDAEGVRHVLYAFSGQLGDSGFLHPGSSVLCSTICSPTVISRQRKPIFPGRTLR